ncbi:sulfate transporter family protein, partial [Vibrio harveyi]
MFKFTKDTWFNNV